MDPREREGAASQSLRPRTLSDWDYLLGVPDQSRLGALRLRDPDSGPWLDDRIPSIPPITRLPELEVAAIRLEAIQDSGCLRTLAPLFRSLRRLARRIQLRAQLERPVQLTCRGLTLLLRGFLLGRVPGRLGEWNALVQRK